MKFFDKVMDEYYGICKLLLFFVAGCIGWMEAIALIGGVGRFIVGLF